MLQLRVSERALDEGDVAVSKTKKKKKKEKEEEDGRSINFFQTAANDLKSRRAGVKSLAGLVPVWSSEQDY
jgi:hypothetical protein